MSPDVIAVAIVAKARSALVAAALLALAGAAAAQPAPPLAATLTLKNPPPGGVYAPDAPVSMLLEIANVTSGPVTTTADFSAGQLWRRLVFTNQAGGTLTNDTAAAVVEADTRVSFCLSRRGVLVRPTAIPVVPVEVLPPGPSSPTATDGFVLHYDIEDARQFYDLRPGRYTVNARIPLLTFRTAAGGTLDDCDQFEGQTVANLAAIAPGDSFTVLSNEVQFVVASPLRLLFKGVVKSDAVCPSAAQTPCKSAVIGKPIKMQFQVLDPAGVTVPNLTARISFTKVGGGLATLASNTARYDAKKRLYLFDLPTRGLTPGSWRIDVALEQDGAVHSAHMLLKGRR